MMNNNTGPAHAKRGVNNKAGRMLLAAALSATLAASPSGLTALAATADASDAGASAAAIAFRTAAADGQLSINPGKLELKAINTYFWPNLTIDTSDPSTLIYSATIQFTSAIDAGDEIDVTASGNFTILNASKHGNKTVNNAQGATALEWREYLRNSLTVQLTNSDKTANIRITLSLTQTDRTVEYFAGTGHYYELVSPGHVISWSDAFNGATQRQYMGMQGYLATIMSVEENNFVTSLIQANSWLGATCDPAYVKPYFPNITSPSLQFYVWVAGPEAGTQIHTNRYNVSGYSNWASGEPNNNEGLEYYLHIYGEGSARGWWNDFPNTHSNPGYLVKNYIVEYGGMPDDEIGVATDGSMATIDIKLDPSGKTLSTTLDNARFEFDGTKSGVALSVTANVNGEVLPAESVTHTFYIEDASQPDGWRELGVNELGTNGTPIHAGSYKVVSNAAYVDDEGMEQAYAPGSATFAIVPKAIDLTSGDEPVVTKTYDGTDVFDVSGIDISKDLFEGTDVRLDVGSYSIGGEDASSAGDKTLILSGVALSGSDAGDYRVAGLNADGSLNLRAQILPRELGVSTDASVKRGYIGSPLGDLGLGSNLSVRDAGSNGVWLENELAPCDGSIGDDGVLSTILGEETFVAKDGDKVLDPEDPEKGTYKVEAHYANVNPVDADGMPVEPSGPLNVIKIDDYTYDIGNYILTIKPATITITSRSTGGVVEPGEGDVDDPDGDDSGSGITFAPIDTATDVRIDPSSSGTVGGDSYFEYEAGKPVNILDMIQVRPEGADGWSDWMGGTGPGSDGSDDPNGSGPSSPGNPSNPTNPDGTGNPSDPSDPTNPDGSGSGTGPDGQAPQLPDNVKVTVTDEMGAQVDETNIKDPGTYEVTVSVKDPYGDEYIIIETLTFHVVDTSITDTDYIYKDVAKDHWGHGYIFDIGPVVINGAFNPSDVALGYMGGYAGTTDFGPSNGIIRGDAAIVIWRMAGCPDVEGDDKQGSQQLLSLANAHCTGFTDCDADPTMYWNQAIAWCASKGIVEGYEGTGEYRPQSKITREEFASIIARYASFKGKDVASADADLSQYPDIEHVSDWAAPNMGYVVANGIMTGRGTDEGTADGTHGILDPQAHVTRAEVAKMAYMEQPCRR